MNRFYAPVSYFLLTIVIGIGISCTNDQPKTDENYAEKINEWHRQRISALKEEDSWLSLAGLYKLEKGTQTFGADSSNDIVFLHKAPAHIGTITRTGNNFSLKIQSGVKVTHDSSQVSQIELITSADGDPTTLRSGSLLWYIIERRGNYYIRLKDTRHPNFDSFDGIDRFPVSKDWRVKATFKRFDEPKSISIPDALGDVYQDSLYGTLQFTIDGRQYSLAPLGHPDEADEFFIILGDKTNGNTTYGGGRYIYIPTPNENGVTYLDFNKAYNPPCVFTNFATCPLPPPQNRLDLKVTAGEKMYKKSH